jgi:SH3-like domain-containing protein
VVASVAKRSLSMALAAAVFATVLSTAAFAQGIATRDAPLFAAPGDRPIATVRRGTALTTGETQRGYSQTTVDGWLAAALLGASRDSFPLAVKPGAGVRLRAAANPQSPVVADLRAGMGLNEIERKGAWIHVRRSGWVQTASIGAAADVPTAVATSSATSAPPTASVTPPAMAPSAPDTTRNGFILTPIASTALAASPAGTPLGTLGPGARATVTARERGWVRVRVEGWVREADLSVADTALRGALSAADIRADPDGTVGRLVRWEVEVLAHQTADPLRKGLADQEPYLLAQGPSGENALLYLAIPPALAAAAREVPDLSRAIVTARVRAGRSEPVGIPVLELLTIVGR